MFNLIEFLLKEAFVMMTTSEVDVCSFCPFQMQRVPTKYQDTVFLVMMTQVI